MIKNRQDSVIVDIHAHIGRKELFKNIPWMHDIDDLRRQQDEAGIDISVLSTPLIDMPWEKGETVCLDLIKDWNDFAIGVVQKSEGRFLALAATNPFGNDSYLKEVERVVKQGGMKGICINSSVRGEYLDSPRAFPLYEMAIELDVPILVHPPGVTMGSEFLDKYRLTEMVGRPCDTTLSMARFIFSGVLEKYKQLKIILVHMGGALMMLPGRFDFGYRLRAESKAFGPWEPDVLTMPPSGYIKKLHVDTLGFHPPALRCAIDTIGVDNILLGSDHPPVPIPLRESVDLIKNIALTEIDRRKILGLNAARLLKI
ncbi:MAG: amidohydrolase family protein [Lentisphaerota bacterium]